MHEPTTEAARSVRDQVTSERWAKIIADAERDAAVFDAVIELRATKQLSWRIALARVAPSLPWSTFMGWRRQHAAREGPTWERLLDHRVPPSQRYPDELVMAAELLRRIDKDINTSDAAAKLIEMFGPAGKVSPAWLKRVWRAAGLNRGRGRASPKPQAEAAPQGEGELYHGGAGLALLAAAEAETGSLLRLAEAALQDGKAQAALAPAPTEETTDVDDARDERGRFTAEYNEQQRIGTAAGERDERWRSDATKAAKRDLDGLRVLRSKPKVVAAKLFAMGATPLLTERRGFDGLDGPAGEWLGVLGGHAYMPATLDKTLAELGLLSVGDAMWRAHAADWAARSRQWRGGGSGNGNGDGEGWPRSVVYIDGTADPYWTRAFAASGKVSRNGRVMPCLTRVAIHSGAGVPLLVETHAGTATLKQRLLPMLKRLDAAIGPDADVGRLTLVDAEAGTGNMIWAMHQQTNMYFVTVVKGSTRKGATLANLEPWQTYRERDQVRDVTVFLGGRDTPAGGIEIRGVEMYRGDGRRPRSTLLVTNVPAEELPAPEVASWYLSRWPQQEQQFANGRNGGGLNRSHGYGGEHVTHVALEDKKARAERSVAHASRRRELAEQTHEMLDDALQDAPAPARRKALELARRDVRDRARDEDKRHHRKKRVDTEPSEIFKRDVGRDSVMTCLKLAVLSLLEYVFQEYFSGSSMQWRTFIEQFVSLPVRVVETRDERRFIIDANQRQPDRMRQLRGALDEINRRRICQGERQLVFELRGVVAGRDP